MWQTVTEGVVFRQNDGFNNSKIRPVRHTAPPRERRRPTPLQENVSCCTALEVCTSRVPILRRWRRRGVCVRNLESSNLFFFFFLPQVFFLKSDGFVVDLFFLFRVRVCRRAAASCSSSRAPLRNSFLPSSLSEDASAVYVVSSRARGLRREGMEGMLNGHEIYN